MKKMILNVYVPIYNLEYKESYNRRKLCFFFFFFFCMAFSGDSDGKESICNVGDKGSIPGLEEMATHSSIFAWRISWIEEPDGLLSMGLQRVGHD